MRQWIFLVTLLLISSGVAVQAKQKVTVEATNDDISEGLDLKAVATLFGEVKNLAEFEQELNSDKNHINNLDLNGDGTVDYLRIVEVEDGVDQHLIIIQAVLAKDIFQDVASIYVEKSDSNNVAVQVIGDEYIYGVNYVIEPVYIYRPVIYDWFWGPGWVCYHSPWYWGYWPGWYAPYRPWVYHDYCTHIHVYHYDHPSCSYRYARAPHERAERMRIGSSRSDIAHSQVYSKGSFSARTGKSNARDLRPESRSAHSTSGSGGGGHTANTTSRGTVSRGSATYGSSNTQVSRSMNSNGSSRTSSGRTSSSSYSSGSVSRGGSSYSGSSSSSSSYSSGSVSRGSSSASSSGRTSSSSYSSGSNSRGSSSYSGGSRGSGSYSGGSSSSSSSRGASSSPSSSGSRR